MSSFIIDIISSHFKVDKKAVNVSLLSKRYLNDIYTVYINKNEQYVCKITSDLNLKNKEVGHGAFKKEFYLLKKLKHLNFPVPAAIHYGTVNHHDILILEKIMGEPIDNIFWKISKENQLYLLKEINKYIHTIHSIEIDKQLSDLYPEIPDIKISESLKLKLSLYLQKNSNTIFRDSICKLYKSVDTVFQNYNPTISIMHNDLGIRANNILVSKDKLGFYHITGILDWERSKLGDPIEELCRLEVEILKSWISNNINNKAKINNDVLEVLNFDFIKKYNEQLYRNFYTQLMWYRKYVLLMPGKWYLHKEFS